MTTNEFVSMLVTEGLLSRDPHVVKRVTSLVEDNLSPSSVIDGLSDEDLSREIASRAEAKQKAVEEEAKAAEEKAKTDAEEAAAKAKLDADAAVAQVRQERLNAVIKAAITAFDSQESAEKVAK
jgi:hypothetical protein